MRMNKAFELLADEKWRKAYDEKRTAKVRRRQVDDARGGDGREHAAARCATTSGARVGGRGSGAGAAAAERAGGGGARAAAARARRRARGARPTSTG